MESGAHLMNENQQRTMVAGRVVDFSFGTMWWLREWLWKRIVPRRLHYDLGSTKYEHPGISIFIGQPSPQPEVPMMHGCSEGTISSVRIWGFSANDPSQLTSFGHLIRPGMVPRVWIGHFPVAESVLRYEWVRLFGPESNPPTTPQPSIRPGSNKTKATPDECAQLRELLRRLKVII